MAQRILCAAAVSICNVVNCSVLISFAVLALLPCATLHAQESGAPSDSGGLSLEIDPDAGQVIIDGSSAEASLVVVGVGRRMVGFLPTTFRYEQEMLADAEGRGIAEFEEGIPSWSAWVVVDRRTGEYRLAAPPGKKLAEIDFPARGLGATRRFLEDQRRWLEFWVIRPDVGAGNQPTPEEERGVWGLTAGDGGAGDRDETANGSIRLSMLDLQPVGDAPASPEALAPGDIIVGIDGEALEIYAVRLASPPAGGSGGGGA